MAKGGGCRKIGSSGDRVIGKPKALPLMNADYADQESKNFSPLISTDDTAPERGPLEIQPLEFNPGVESCKSIFFGVDRGEGWQEIW
jgi:hypothetical protein